MDVISYRNIGPRYKVSDLCFQSYPCRHYVMVDGKLPILMSGDTIYCMLAREGLSDDYFSEYAEFAKGREAEIQQQQEEQAQLREIQQQRQQEELAQLLEIKQQRRQEEQAHLLEFRQQREEQAPLRNNHQRQHEEQAHMLEFRRQQEKQAQLHENQQRLSAQIRLDRIRQQHHA
jgi:hypothetical protein